MREQAGPRLNIHRLVSPSIGVWLRASQKTTAFGVSRKWRANMIEKNCWGTRIPSFAKEGWESAFLKPSVEQQPLIHSHVDVASRYVWTPDTLQR
jgi:hypothetical protein